MNSIMVSMVAAAGLMVAGAALAADMPDPGKQCLACHAVDKKVVGPAFNDVGAKYRGDKDGARKIAANVTAGGAFGWKAAMKMPPKGGTNLTDDEIKAMATYIAGLGGSDVAVPPVTPETVKKPEVSVTPEAVKKPEAPVTSEAVKKSEAPVTSEAVKRPAAPVTPEAGKKSAAVDMPEAGKKCLVCHAVDKSSSGPSFNEVGAKYRGNRNAVSKIARNITKGGAFGWKTALKMTPRGGTDLTDNEIKAMAKFIAGLGHSAASVPKMQIAPVNQKPIQQAVSAKKAPQHD